MVNTEPAKYHPLRTGYVDLTNSPATMFAAREIKKRGHELGKEEHQCPEKDKAEQEGVRSDDIQG